MYEVFALKYGERDTTKCQFFYRESSHDKLTLDYFVWLILGGPQPLLVDTGFRDDDARARGIRNYVSPAAMVERAGVKPGDIPISLITHLHYDHWAGHSLFPNAEFWIQGEEVAFWTGPFGRLPAFRGSANVEALAHLTTLNYGNKIRIVEGDHEVWPGVRVRRAHVGCLALLSQRRDAAARADHHEPAGDADRLRHDRSPCRIRQAGRRRPRSSSIGALQAGRAGHHQDRVRPGAHLHYR